MQKDRTELQKFFRNSFTRNVATLFSGSVIAQVIPYLLSPIIARVYPVVEQGIFAQVNSVMQVLSSAPEGRLSQAVVLPKSGDKARAVVLAGLYFTVAFSIIALVLVAIFQNDLKVLFNNPGIGHLFYVVPVFVLIVGFQKMFNYWLIRKEAFRQLAILKVIQTSFGSLFILVFGVVALHGGWLLGYVMGWVAYSIASYWYAARNGLKLLGPEKNDVKEAFYEYREFPLYNSIPFTLIEFSKQATIFMTAILYTVEDTGYYNFTRTMILTPLVILAMAIGQVYYQRLALRYQNSEGIFGSLWRMTGVLSGIGVVIVLVFGLFGEEIFTFLFSEKWEMSGKLAEVLVYSYALQFVTLPLNNLLYAVKELKLAAIYPTVYFFAVLSLLLFEYDSFYDFIVRLTMVEVSVFTLSGIIIFIGMTRYERKIKQTDDGS